MLRITTSSTWLRTQEATAGSGGLACRVAKVVRRPNNPVSNYQDIGSILYAVLGVDYQNSARSDSGHNAHGLSVSSYSMPRVFF